MMKLVWAKKIIAVGNMMAKELAKDAPDLIAVESYAEEIAVDVKLIKDKLKNEGVSIDQHIRE